MRRYPLKLYHETFQNRSTTSLKWFTLSNKDVHWQNAKQRRYATESSLPRVAQPSLWQSIIPKFLRRPDRTQTPEKAQRSKEWNPATFFIVMFLLIGSNAMQLLALKNEFAAFTRRADAKIGLLKEVIERVQRGENVDVKGLLGTGNPEKEREWEQGEYIIKEIEEEDRLWQAKARRRQNKESSAGSELHDEEKPSSPTSLPANQAAKDRPKSDFNNASPPKRDVLRGFY
ncbi:MAG: hypothetical protein Q9222_001367 [Ikaeria aurantiellina]